MAAPQTPLPFEDPSLGFWPRVGRTLDVAFRTPMGGFGSLALGSSLGAPWRLKLLLAAPAYLAATLGLTLVQLVVVAASWNRNLPREAFTVCPALLLALLVAGPLFQWLSMVWGGLMLHGLLWLFRGTSAGPGLRQTVRAAGYTQAVVGLLSLVPLLGAAAYPAARVTLGLGLARLHHTDPWRGLAAAWAQAALSLLTAAALILAMVFGLVRLDERSRQIVVPPAELEPLPEAPLSNTI